MTKKIIFSLFVLLSSAPLAVWGQLARSDAFHQQYKLKEVVVLSRHNIRSPLSTNGSELSLITSHEWTRWTSASSELTLRGGVLETAMGQFFRKWTVDEGLFPENATPSVDEVNVYANSMQRTIATAQYFAAGFMPVASLRVHHRFSPSKMDPVFFPRLTKVSDAFKTEALKQIADMGGEKGIRGINESLEPCYKLLEKVLDLPHSPAAKSGKITGFNDYNTQIILELGEEPHMKGSLKTANSASDAFILQYYEEPDSVKAAFGKRLTTAQWEQIARVKDVYGDVLFTAPVVAANVAHPLLQYMFDELNAPTRKFTFLCGHDSNIASVSAALGVMPYELPESIEKKTPIGSKLVLEKWVDKEGHEFVAINMVYQSTYQLRHVQLLNLQTPPKVYALQLKGLRPNAQGLYSLKDVNARFREAFRAYEAIQ